jgi:hypothetical protein
MVFVSPGFFEYSTTGFKHTEPDVSRAVFVRAIDKMVIAMKKIIVLGDGCHSCSQPWV